MGRLVTIMNFVLTINWHIIVIELFNFYSCHCQCKFLQNQILLKNKKYYKVGSYVNTHISNVPRADLILGQIWLSFCFEFQWQNKRCIFNSLNITTFKECIIYCNIGLYNAVWLNPQKFIWYNYLCVLYKFLYSFTGKGDMILCIFMGFLEALKFLWFLSQNVIEI